MNFSPIREDLIRVASNPFCVLSLSCHLFFTLLPWFIFHPASAPSALWLIWENDPWVLRSQVIQGHWQVISADWPTAKRTSEWSQSESAPLTHTSSSSPSHPTLPSSSAACVTWLGRGVRGRMINDAFSTCLEWSCPRCTVITHSQAAAAQHNCFLFVDLVYWGEGWLRLGEKVFPTVDRGDGVRISKILRVSLFLRDREMARTSALCVKKEKGHHH